MKFPNWQDPQTYRDLASKEDIKIVLKYVQEGRCQCCGGYVEEDDRLECGHYSCILCMMRDHICLACAFAV